MTRKKRKIRKLRGSRTCGGGTHEMRRGGGSKGGKGMGGTHKSKWTWAVKDGRGYFGRRGFKVPEAVSRDIKALNVGEIDEKIEELLKSKIAEKKGRQIEIDVSRLKYDKVLGKGKVTRSLIVKALGFSETAKRKIEDAKGKCILLER